MIRRNSEDHSSSLDEIKIALMDELQMKEIEDESTVGMFNLFLDQYKKKKQEEKMLMISLHKKFKIFERKFKEHEQKSPSTTEGVSANFESPS